MYHQQVPITDLIGKTPVAVHRGTYERNAAILFGMSDGTAYALGHKQDCCEDFILEDIVGDLNDLVGAPLLVAEAPSSEGTPAPAREYIDSSYTWTFYKFATIKGYVDLRFFGTSNGYYSEEANVYLIDDGAKKPVPPVYEELPDGTFRLTNADKVVAA